MIQRVLLYASPLFLAVFGFNFPIAVLLYWLTTNAWSMGQQHFIIKRMPPLQIGKSGAPAPAVASSGGGGLTSLLKGKSAEPPAPAAPTRLTQKRQTPPSKDAGVSNGTSSDGAASGAVEAGTDRAGTDRAGTDRAGTDAAGTDSSAGTSRIAGSSASGDGSRNVRPAKAGARPGNRPGGSKKRGGKSSRRGGRR
jgi:YidC/Oxa1 family membrane protein insertase